MNTTQKASLLSGVMLIAGCAVGAGMFSLPVVSSGMWFPLCLISLFLPWWLNYIGSLYILEVNTHFEPGANFDTFTTKLLGKGRNIFVGACIAFVLAILLYAYFSAFGNTAKNTLGNVLPGSQGFVSLLLGGVLAVMIWYSSKLVGKIATALVFGMVITFIISMSGLTLQIDVATLFNTNADNKNYTPYIWAALSSFMTAFAYMNLVPSLYKMYGGQPKLIKKSVLYGSLIAFAVYALFLIVSFGNISRDQFIEINAAGGNMGDLVRAFGTNTSQSTIYAALNIFSNFAIISSFLGVGLALFDYVADTFSFDDTHKGRLYAALITFVPPGFASFFFPNGFIAAIGFAGLVLIIGFFISSFFLAKKARSLHTNTDFTVKGGSVLLWIFLLGNIMIGVFEVLKLMGVLAVW